MLGRYPVTQSQSQSTTSSPAFAWQECSALQIQCPWESRVRPRPWHVRHGSGPSARGSHSGSSPARQGTQSVASYGAHPYPTVHMHVGSVASFSCRFLDLSHVQIPAPGSTPEASQVHPARAVHSVSSCTARQSIRPPGPSGFTGGLLWSKSGIKMFKLKWRCADLQVRIFFTYGK